jgi:hypothetical protein
MDSFTAVCCEYNGCSERADMVVMFVLIGYPDDRPAALHACMPHVAPSLRIAANQCDKAERDVRTALGKIGNGNEPKS